jgi:DNA invertase Pin-like site-specific DNA recombinase
MRAVSYIRVSTEDQSINGVSLGAQNQKILQYAELYNHRIIESVEDAGLSAKNLNRPGIQKILSMVRKKEIEAVIIAKLDRLTRSVRDLAFIVELFNKNDVALISVNENLDSGTAAGRMILNMLGTIAQWERETIGERTSAALQYKKMNGKVFGKDTLYGYKKDRGLLVPYENEQRAIREILHCRSKGWGFSKIANALNRKRYSTRSRNRWFPQQVKRVIENTPIRKKIENTTPINVAA